MSKPTTYLKPFVEVEITVKDDQGGDQTWTVEYVPGTRCDTYVFRPSPKVYHPGNWSRMYPEVYNERLAEYQAWFNKCVWLHTNVTYDLHLLKKWGIVS